MDARVGPYWRLSAEELMLLNCGVGEDSWESLGLQGDQTLHPKGNQSWIFIVRTDAEGPIFDHLIWKNDSVEKTLMQGKIKGRRKRGQQRMKWLHGITDSMHTSLSRLHILVMDREACLAAVYEAARVRHNWATELSFKNHKQVLW